MSRWLSTLLLIGLLSVGLYAQVGTDSLARDSVSTEVVPPPLDLKAWPHAPTALKWALIPGGGQVYNRAWWKVPIVYGGILGAVGYAEFNQRNYRRMITALRAKCFGVDDPDNCTESPHEFTGTVLDDTDALRSRRDAFDKNRQQAYIFIFIVYLAQGIEAFTDAHLKTFDIEDDLALRLGPINAPGTHAAFGLSLALDGTRGLRRQRREVAWLLTK